MSSIHNLKFEDLLVYQKALNFSHEIFTETKGWPKEHTYSIIDQLRRASLSIVLNLAEGSSRTNAEFRRFITISRGSAHECIPIIEIAFRQKYITSEQKEIWVEEIISISKMLSKLKSSIS